LIPVGLLEAIKGGRVVLFLGAGASRGAIDRKTGEKIPLAGDLKKKIATQFLGAGYDEADFKTVYDFAASHRSVREVQEFLHAELTRYRPVAFHLHLPKFVWAGLATTNYDLVVERAYEDVPDKLQTLIPNCRDGDGAMDKLGDARVLYVKLHGCISHYQEVAPPMVASTEQIINHRDGRTAQFAQFLEWAKTRTIVFAGYGIGDANLRALFEEVRRDGDNRPRHYIVRPGISEVEEHYWSDRRVQTVSMEFEEFLAEIDRFISLATRKLALVPVGFVRTTFTRFIAKFGRQESPALIAYLETKCQHVSNELVAETGNPARFYSGFDMGWLPVATDLDVRRRVSQSILEERIVTTQAITSPQFVLLKSHAGGGKSVALRRIAWDASHGLGRLVFFVQDAADIDVDLFEEIVGLVNQTVYLIVDDVAESVEDVQRLLRRAEQRKWPLVVIGGARFNEWNARCELLQQFVDSEYELHYLSQSEIDQLLSLLAKYNALGYLASIPVEQRRERLKEMYGRQLLVALHEATKNAIFRDIIRDEYNNIYPRDAQLLYLDICALHRFGPPVRAGLIARVHGINFEEFHKRFFAPLEQVIDLQRDPRTGDWAYRARHSLIAEIVYSEVLTDVSERFDNFMRIVTKLNPGYSYDREVLHQLVRASNLAEIFTDRTKGEAIYDAALSSLGRDPGILHQRGIYEMRLGNDRGALDRAEKFLSEALELLPNNRPIKHSLSELALKRSFIAIDKLERATWRSAAEKQASELTKSDHTSHAHHTLTKAAIATVRDSLEAVNADDTDLTQEALGQAIKKAEDAIRSGLQTFPNDSHLLNEEAILSEILQNADRALNALKRAFRSNPNSELIARRYARILRSKNLVPEAIDVLKQGLDRNPGSQVLNYDMAQSLRSASPNADQENAEQILYHLSRSFAAGDKHYEAQFWYARQLCLMGQSQKANPIFDRLKALRLPYDQKHRPRGPVLDVDGAAIIYHGEIYQRASLFGFIRADKDRLECFFNVPAREELGQRFEVGRRVQFHLEFSLFGPVAVGVNLHS